MYENFYHLRAKPFRLSPDPSFFFASRGHKRALAYLRYGLSQSEGFVVITGAPGTGKTTLAQILLKEMSQSDVVVAHLTTTQLEADEMLRMVLASFGLRYEGQNKAGLLKTLEAFFMARSRENKRVLLVVDEAQNLPARSLEELRMLSNLQVGEHALLQTFLLGQVQFRQMLDHPDLEQLRQRVIANYHLSALGEDECQNYIESRLAHVGWNDDPHFSDEAFDIIFKYTEGIPRRINMLCDRVLLFSSLEEQHTINAKVLQEVTDELQSEISGKPIARPAQIETDVLLETTPDAESSAKVEAKTTKPKVSPQRESAATDFSNSDVETTPVYDNGGMDRAMPDDGWTQHVAQAQPDHIETDNDSDSNNNEPAEMERFRVIAGSKGGVESSAETVAERPANEPETDVMAPLPDAPGDPKEVVLRKILRLVLAFHRSPRSFPGLDDPSQPLPKGINAILELSIADDHVLSGLRQIAVMGISPAMLRSAVRFFVRRVLFLPGGDDFRVLGVASNADLTEVEAHYGLLMKLLRQDKKENDESGVVRVGEAYERLCRSEITARPGDIQGTPDDIGDVEETLDLDLSPNSGGRGANSGLRPASVSASEIVTSEERTAPMTRNLMLIAGAVVIVFILYLTQIKTTETVSPEVIADVPSEQIVDVPSEQIADVPSEQVVAIKPALDSEVVTEDLSVATILPAEESQPVPALVAVDAAEEQIVVLGEAKQTTAAEGIAKVERLAKEKAKAEEAKAEEAKAEEAKAEEAKAEEAKAEAAATLKAAAMAKLQLEAEIKARAESKAKAQAKIKAKARADAKAKIVARKRAEEQARAVANAKAEALRKTQAKMAVEAKPRAASSAGLVSAASLNKMLATFSAAYQAGDMNTLLSLHSPVVRTNKYIDVASLRKEYQAQFKNSIDRSMHFKNITWERKVGYARGSGEYTSLMTGKAGQPNYEESGDVTLQVESREGKLQIIRYYTSNVVVTERVTTQSKVVAENAASSSTNPFSRIPTKNLGALLNKLITAYAAGDIDAFMKLFAKDAQTNDRATVNGIREDYVALFKNTSFREIAFTKLQWTWDGRIARGDGTYNVKVQPNGQNKRDHYQGQVWIQIERRDGGPRITHFAFSE